MRQGKSIKIKKESRRGTRRRKREEEGEKEDE
jgi:hypothetical protein